MKILYAAEEEKVTIDEQGNLTISHGSGAGGAGTGAGTGTGDQQMNFDMEGAMDDEMLDTAEEAKKN